MKKIRLSPLLIGFLLFALQSCSDKPYDVKVAGNVKDVMHGKSLENHIRLDTILAPGIYGVGPNENLRGEITVVDGVPYVSTVENGKMVTRIDSSVSAPFFVYSPFKYRKVRETVSWRSVKDIENTLKRLKGYFNIPKNQAFPFVVEAEFSKIQLHVIMRDPNEKEHSHEAHKEAKVPFKYKSIRGRLIGFYSTEHEGVFTHEGSHIHVHFLSNDGKITGHLDNLRHLSTVAVSIPRF